MSEYLTLTVDIPEVSEYCRVSKSSSLENKVTSTSLLENADQVFSPPSLPFIFPSSIPAIHSQPIRSALQVSKDLLWIYVNKTERFLVQILPGVEGAEGCLTASTPPTIFRPPGLEDSDDDTKQEEDVKPDVSVMMSPTTTLHTHYPSMLRLLHPHLYRHYHPYLHLARDHHRQY